MSVGEHLTAPPLPHGIKLDRVRCVAADPSLLAGLFEALGADAVTLDASRLVVALGDSSLEFDSGEPRGIVGIDFVSAHQESTRSSPSSRYEHQLSGLAVSIVKRDGTGPLCDALITEGRSRIDHVAIVVADLETAEQQWSQFLGEPAQAMGVHPASDGAFRASRIVLGAQMIELISPMPGVDSSIARRLATYGDGPATLAIPVGDLVDTVRRLESLSVRLVRTDHHVMIHPEDAGGILTQLTPRVEH